MAEKDEPPEPPPGKTWVLYRPKGSKLFSAHIVLPGGIRDVFETGMSERQKAFGVTNGQVRRLYKKHKMESPLQWKRRTGSRLALSTIRYALAMGKQPDESAANPRRKAADSAADDDGADERVPASAGLDAAWERNLVRIENKFSLGFQRIMNLMLLGVGGDDALVFREHVRAIVAEVALQGITPTGKLQKKYGPRR